MLILIWNHNIELNGTTATLKGTLGKKLKKE